ncbi:MAG: hypothetical protein KAT05_12530 [Spirochaetes bacterium]|nr:hypothetical protein [Spirochaetota bacterium]
MKKIRIAYSMCGEGHGHYGRNVEIIRLLSKRLPNCEIDLYLYGDTWNIFSMDKEIPKNVKINKIPGFRFMYEKTGAMDSMGSTLANFDNIGVFLRTIKLDFLHTVIFPLRKLIAKIRNKPDEIANRYYMKYFKEFDFAIADLEPLLPRVAVLRKRPFLTLDNQHVMLYGDFDTKVFTIKERLEHLFVRNSLKILHPVSDLFVLSCFYKIPIKPKYANFVKEIGPLIRENLKRLRNEIEYEDFILVYAHKILRDKLFPVLTRLGHHKYIVFTTDDSDHEDFTYKREWIEYHSIDPVKFIQFFVKCKAVISTAGNTLITEALFLKKPFFGISLEGNFEQRLNLYMLEKSGFGDGCKISEFSEEHIRHFFDNLEKYQKRLKTSNIQDNTDTLVTLIIEKIKNDVKNL